MDVKTFVKTAMYKQADLGQALAIVGAASFVAATAGGAALGAGIGKLSLPGYVDMKNLLKLYKLSRLRGDNSRQQVMALRLQAERDMRNKTKKPVRMFL